MKSATTITIDTHVLLVAKERSSNLSGLIESLLRAHFNYEEDPKVKTKKDIENQITSHRARAHELEIKLKKLKDKEPKVVRTIQ